MARGNCEKSKHNVTKLCVEVVDLTVMRGRSKPVGTCWLVGVLRVSSKLGDLMGSTAQPEDRLADVQSNRIGSHRICNTMHAGLHVCLSGLSKKNQKRSRALNSASIRPSVPFYLFGWVYHSRPVMHWTSRRSHRHASPSHK